MDSRQKTIEIVKSNYKKETVMVIVSLPYVFSEFVPSIAMKMLHPEMKYQNLLGLEKTLV